MKKKSSPWLAVLSVIVASLFHVPAMAAWPDKPVRLVLPLAPGGSMDVLGRGVAKALSTQWQTPVIVENRAGAGGNIGAEQVARADADGYTLLLTTNMLIANETLFKGNINYDATHSFDPISIVAAAPAVIVVRNDSSLHNLKDLEKLAVSQVVNVGTPGFGNSNHIALAHLQRTIDGTLEHIPYKGAGPAVVGLLGGETDLAIVALPAVAGQIKTGALRALAVAQEARSSIVPDTPTVKQSGFDVDTGPTWFGLLAPAGTPTDVIANIQHAVQAAVSSGELNRQLIGLGFEPVGGSTDAFKQRIALDVVSFPKVLKTAEVAVN